RRSGVRPRTTCACSPTSACPRAGMTERDDGEVSCQSRAYARFPPYLAGTDSPEPRCTSCCRPLAGNDHRLCELDPPRLCPPSRPILAGIWLTIASIASIGLLYRLHEVVFDLVLATFIALVLNPVVLRLQRVGLGRGPAILAVTAIFFLVFVGLGAAVAAPITSQGVKFAKQAPQYLKQAQEG